MKNYLPLFFMFLLSGSLLAQKSTGLIKGIVFDEAADMPLEFTTISVLNAEDSSVVTGAISDEKGMFAIDVEFGKYLIKYDFISYNPEYVDNVEISIANRTADLGIVKLSEAAEMLDEIEVVAEKSEMQFSLDKRVFNVGRDLANKGGSAEDILDNIPSVTVDVEGNVELRGSQNVRILINGKPSGLIGIGDSGGLKSLPAGMIERVEVVTNASAKYEAEGTAGIINIVLKQDRSQGFNGSVDLTAGFPNNYGASVNVNMRRDWINFFANYGIRYRENPGRGYTLQEFYTDEAIPYSEQYSTRNHGGTSNSLRGGVDLYLSDRDIITGAILYRYGKDFSDSKVEFQDFNADRVLENVSYRYQYETETEPTLEYELNYERKFDKKDQKLTAQLQYRNNQEVEAADYREEFYDAFLMPLNRDNLIQRSNNTENQSNLLFQTDYVHPLGKDKKLELGARISLRDISNDYLVEELEEASWVNLLNISNHFQYAEDIYAGYMTYGEKINRFSYQLGLRAEHSRVVTELVETNEVNDRSYTNLFPTAHLNYEINEGNAIQASFSRRISRPRFWYLNPFFTFSNTRRIWGGNPNLDPEFTNSVELGYLKYWDNVSLGTSIYYRHSTGVIERITRVIENGITRTQPENLSTADAVGFEMNLGADFTKWWRLDLSGNAYYATSYGQVGEQVFDAETFTFTNRASSKIKFWKDAEFQARFNYRAPRNTAQGRSKSIYSLDLAFSKDILDKKGTFSISARDIFNSRRYRYEVFDEFFYSEAEHQRRSRFVIFSFNYRLNQKKRRGRDSGGEDFDGGDMM